MDAGKILLGGAGFAAITAFWSQIKGFFARFKSIFIVTAELNYNTQSIFARYLWNNFRCSMLGSRNYTSSNIYVKPNKSWELVLFEELGGSLTFFKGWRPIFTSKAEGSDGNLSIHFIRGTFKIEKLLLDAIKEFNDFEKVEKEASSRYYVRHYFGSYGELSSQSEDRPLEDTGPSSRTKPIGWTWNDLGPLTAKSPFSALFYPDEIKNFIKYLERWKNSEDWYKDRGLPWRTGALLKGPPGTGKSSFIRAVGQHFDLPIDVYDLVSMSNEELVKFWRRSLNHAPCIVLIEDIDRVFNDDKLIQQDGFSGKGKLTMDCLLNTISGVESADGILVFVTANDATKLDDALGVPDERGISSRPGRLDKILVFDKMQEDCRISMANLILSDCPNLIEETVKDGDGEMGALFEKRCSDIALREFWKA